jgi:glycosyltransferase involved in cell wall biosynthesis
LHISQRDDPAEGGAVRVATEYVKHLPLYDINAHCLFLYGEPGSFQKELGDRAHYLKIQNSRQFWKFGRLIQFIINFKPDIIHHHDGLLWSNILTFFHPGIVKVAHAHLCANNLSGKLRGLLAAWIQRQSTDVLLCISKDTQNSHITIGGYKKDRTKVIYNGIDNNRFYPPSLEERQQARFHFGFSADNFVVGYVGRLDCTMKGADDFLKTFALLPDFFYALVVGDGCNANYLKELAKKLQITERVLFVGILEQTKIAYHAMDIFCLTSHWEHFGLVVAEAMACQVPVVGFQCLGGVNELLTATTGHLITQRNHQLMAQTIIDIINNPQNNLKHQSNADQLLKQNHSWQQNTFYLSALYQDLITTAKLS